MKEQKAIPDQDNWDAWDPAELSHRLSSVSRPWCVVGGWALDLWHGTKTREHEDLEFTILREDLHVFRHALNGMELYAVSDGELQHLTDDQEPQQEISQIWCFDNQADCWRADMMIDLGTDDYWVYKRDRQIRRLRSEMVALTASRIPYLNPSAVLLFKAKYCRAKDEDDFARALPRLSPSERIWLKDCLGHLYPGHAWLEMLSRE